MAYISEDCSAYLEENFVYRLTDKNLNEVPTKEATHLHLDWRKSDKSTEAEELEYEGKELKLPAKKMVTESWVEGKLSAGSVYTSFAPKFKAAARAAGISANVFPTTYGLGVDNFYIPHRVHQKEVESILDNAGIEYRNEVSAAGLVYRFVISKSKENIARLEAF